MRYLNFLIIFLLLSFPVVAQDTTTLAWDYSTEDEQYLIQEGGGFKIYFRDTQNGPVTMIVNITDPTARQVTFDTSGLRGRDYFVATAWIPDKESDYSNQISIPFKPVTPGNLREQ